jgi:hypothetical protein
MHYKAQKCKVDSMRSLFSESFSPSFPCANQIRDLRCYSVPKMQRSITNHGFGEWILVGEIQAATTSRIHIPINIVLGGAASLNMVVATTPAIMDLLAKTTAGLSFVNHPWTSELRPS